MRLARKDAAGLVLVAGTLSVMLLHEGPFRHPDSRVADAGGSVTSALAEPAATAFVDFNVVPMDRDVVLTHQVVVVRGGFIERIGEIGEVEPPLGAHRIEGGGSRYLVPGLTDAHVHLDLDKRVESLLPLFLANGVTTVFNLQGEQGHLDLRRRILANEQVGPTVYTAGPYVSEPEIRTAADARTVVRWQAGQGYDFVKVHGDLSAEAFAALTRAGRTENIPIIGHAPRNLPFSAVLENGQVGVTHAEELIHTRLWSLDTNELAGLASEMAEAGTWLTPTLAHFESIADQWASPEAVEARLGNETAQYLPEWLLADWRDSNTFGARDPGQKPNITRQYEFHAPLIRALHSAGVPILAGTDTPILLPPGFSLHSEIEALRDAGMSGFEALATATSNPGRFVRTHVREFARFGTIEPGARADILLVDSDPRDNLAVLRRPRGVMVRGRWYDRSDLDRMLFAAAASR